MEKGNVLFITMDQVPARVFKDPLASLCPTPNIDRLAADATSFSNHFTVTVPCGPSRASLLTGLYAMNHRSVRNGAPLARHHATVATEARKVGYEPLLFGYTDATRDPGGVHPEDPELQGYEGVAPGFREIVEMRLDEGFEWLGYLRRRGYAIEVEPRLPVAPAFRPVPSEGAAPRPSDPALYAAGDSDTAYLTDRTLAELDVRKDRPWFAHLSFVRPHPPLVAPEPYNRLIDPHTVPKPKTDRPGHPFMDAWFSEPSKAGLYWGFHGDCLKIDTALARECIAVYLGLLAEVDVHIGRILDWLEETGQIEHTLIVLTSDHGDMLGERGLWGKDCIFEDAYRIPLILRDPRRERAAQVDRLTESVDVMPTILDWIGAAVPPAVDGRSLLAVARGDEVSNWRDAVLMEVDFGHPGQTHPISAALRAFTR